MPRIRLPSFAAVVLSAALAIAYASAAWPSAIDLILDRIAEPWELADDPPPTWDDHPPIPPVLDDPFSFDSTSPYLDDIDLTHDFGAEQLGYKPLTLPSAGASVIARLSNQGATLENNEPTEGGLMQRTVWARLAMRGNARIVVHTFGSDFDTVLAVYRGTTIPTLARVTGNDNRAVPGVGATYSLVQFDAVKNVPYSIQLGSKTGAEGDILANVFAFPPMGGLAVFPANVAGPNLGDFVCGYRSDAPPCGSRQFIVYNSTDHTLVVTATHNLGAGVTAPAQVTLAPRALTTMTFQFTAGFDQTTVRTVVGYFTFTGRIGSLAFATAKSRAIVIVKPPGLNSDVLRAVVIPQVRAGPLSEPIPLEAKVTNFGSQAAIGCHVRRSPFNPTRASWQRIDPTTKKALAEQYVPATIPPGQTSTFFVLATSREPRIADATFVGTTQPFTIDCANTNSAPITLANSFDITVRGGYDPARVFATKLAPAGGVLDVPAAGAGFRISAVNLGPTATLIARPSYKRPFGESQANKQFTMTVCRTNAAGTCTTAEFDTIEFSAAKDVINRFKVIVRPPTVDPGYAPGARRVFLIFAQVQPIGFAYSVPVAAQSIAVRKN